MLKRKIYDGLTRWKMKDDKLCLLVRGARQVGKTFIIELFARENYKHYTHIKAMFDFRTRLTDAQHYAADWPNLNMVDDFIRSMDFTHDEATAETPVSACNVALSVAPTIRMICSLGVMNFISFAKGGPLRKFVQIDAASFTLDAF